jgi:hypothetical protein
MRSAGDLFIDNSGSAFLAPYRHALAELRDATDSARSAQAEVTRNGAAMVAAQSDVEVLHNERLRLLESGADQTERRIQVLRTQEGQAAALAADLNEVGNVLRRKAETARKRAGEAADAAARLRIAKLGVYAESLYVPAIKAAADALAVLVAVSKVVNPTLNPARQGLYENAHEEALSGVLSALRLTLQNASRDGAIDEDPIARELLPPAPTAGFREPTPAQKHRARLASDDQA